MDDVGSIVEPTSSLAWADVIHVDFQRFISRYIQNISTCLPCKAQRGLRTIFIQKSKPQYAYLPGKIVAVWIDRFASDMIDDVGCSRLVISMHNVDYSCWISLVSKSICQNRQPAIFSKKWVARQGRYISTHIFYISAWSPGHNVDHSIIRCHTWRRHMKYTYCIINYKLQYRVSLATWTTEPGELCEDDTWNTPIAL